MRIPENNSLKTEIEEILKLCKESEAEYGEKASYFNEPVSEQEMTEWEEANGVKIPYVIKDRRPGDIATCYADSSKAQKELGWSAQYGIREMCADAWRWQSGNPNGYEE